jgi:hypothetical protein
MSSPQNKPVRFSFLWKLVRLSFAFVYCLFGYAVIGALLFPLIGILGGAVAYALRPKTLDLEDYLVFGLVTAGRYAWIGAILGALYVVRVVVGEAAAEIRRLRRS